MANKTEKVIRPILFAASFVLSLSALCQKPTEVWNPPVGQDRFLFSFTNDMWLDVPEGVELRPYSPGISTHIMYDYRFGKSPISFAWGYGFSSHNVHSNATFVTDSVNNEEYLRLVPFEGNYSYKKNKLSANYVEIPLELRLRTKGDNQFKLYLGGKIGYQVSVHSKTKDGEGKRKFYGLDGINELQYGVTAKIGFNMIALSGYYALTTLLEEGKGDQFTPISLGLTFFLL